MVHGRKDQADEKMDVKWIDAQEMSEMDGWMEDE